MSLIAIITLLHTSYIITTPLPTASMYVIKFYVRTMYIAVILLGVVGFCMAGMDPDKKLLAEGIKYAAECAANNEIKFSTCLEMYQEGTDVNDAKYDTCKCWIPCVAKKMKVMNDDGQWQMEGIQTLITNLQHPEWKAEAEKVIPMCKDVGGTGCEPGFNGFVCVMKNSEKAKAYVMKMLQAMSGH